MLEIHFGAEQETLRTFVGVLDQITIGAVPAPGMFMPLTRPQRACPQCTAAVPAGFRFCPQCGTPS